MKLASYLHDGRESYGVVLDDGICDLPSAWPDCPAGVLELLQVGASAVERAGEIARSSKRMVDFGEVRRLAPIPRPPKLLALAGNYVKHIKESKHDKGTVSDWHETTTPRPFMMPTTAVNSPGAEIPWPVYSETIDYEVELAVVVGRRCKCVSPEEAQPCVAGFTIANDVSARSTTFADGRAERQPWDGFYDWLNGKWADGFCPLGPYLVTADEIPDPGNLDISLRVNDELRQDANTSMMIFDPFETVSFCSHLMTLLPGDVICTGTPSGVGAATKTWLKSDDVITCRIEKLGELENTLGPRPDSFFRPCAK